jgi:hypothetical protein
LVKGLKALEKRQAPTAGASGLGALGGLAGMFGVAKNGPASKVAEIQEVKPIAFPDAKALKIRYGPIRMPPTSEKNWQSIITKNVGMSDTVLMGAKKPCSSSECTIFTLYANLEFADGKPADNNNGVGRVYEVLKQTLIID